VFGPAKWLRFLITPPSGRVLIHRDYCQQEVRIAAVLSGDKALLQACETGDVYLGIAEQLGFIGDGMTPAELEAVRTLFKTVVLGIQYGLGPRSLAVRTGRSLFEACEILARLRARFHVFEAYAQRVVDHAGLRLEIGTPFGWYMQCPSGINPRTVRNFPIQSTGAEILHVACVLAERRGIELVAPVHDAIMAEAPFDNRRRHPPRSTAACAMHPQSCCAVMNFPPTCRLSDRASISSTSAAPRCGRRSRNWWPNSRSDGHEKRRFTKRRSV
jgi:DNA polymerase I